jgi:hypothetical protein
MEIAMRIGISLLLPLVWPAFVRADGGTMQLSTQRDGYRVTLFTSPTPLRAGPVDFSVLIQTADTEVIPNDVSVTIDAYPRGEPQRRVGGMATTAVATNKLFRAIQLDLSESGYWQVDVAISDGKQTTRVQTELVVAPPGLAWSSLGLWIGWPAAVILLFGIHLCLVDRANKRRAR